MKNTTALSPWDNKESDWILFAVSVIVLTGLLGNVLVIIVTIMNSVFKTTANALIVNLAITDVLSLCSFGVLVFNLKKGKWMYGNLLCKLNGFSAMTFSLASALSISCISINRFLYTVHSPAYNSFFGPTKRTLVMLTFLWVFTGTFGSLPMVGWSEYEYFPSRGFCFWSVSSSLSYTITYYCLVGPCCLSAIYCYWRIYRTIHKNAPNQVTNATQSRVNIRKQLHDHTIELSERKITISIWLVVIFYYATLAPFTIANLLIVWKPGFVLTPELDITTTVIAMTNYSVNVFIYSMSNRRYRLAIRRLFQKVKDFFWSSETKVQSISSATKKKQKIQKRKQSQFL